MDNENNKYTAMIRNANIQGSGKTEQRKDRTAETSSTREAKHVLEYDDFHDVIQNLI